MQLEPSISAAVTNRAHLGQAVLVDRIVQTLQSAVDRGLRQSCQVVVRLARTGEALVVILVQNCFVSFEVFVLLNGCEHGQTVRQHAPSVGLVPLKIFVSLFKAPFLKRLVVVDVLIFIYRGISLFLTRPYLGLIGSIENLEAVSSSEVRTRVASAYS